MTDAGPLDSDFDVYATNYDDALAQGLSVSGEDKTYFARGRVQWLRGCLRALSHTFPLEKINDAFREAEWYNREAAPSRITRAALAP